ncbi:MULTISPECIES: cytochrome c [unclassified Methylocystis]|uniref:c-type cytochrome n=1 Tax=unclassified Methylocystis TaxID=2625913 RepID=UPI0019249EF1|nr:MULTISPECIES: cytochrome c [unclassified Methylocystis]MBL1255394.1 cytochrome c [Methylocystis sp. Sn-Cys]MDJ0449686.1 cytochrome c [Methylocystis sp. JR02]
MASYSRAPVFISLAASAALFAAPALAAGDAQKGAVIAKRWCASCHVVSGDQTTAVADAPSFFDIAKRRADKKQIGNFLIDPHPPMPDMHLSRREIDDITSYIRSLDPSPQPPEQKDKDDALPQKG